MPTKICEAKLSSPFRQAYPFEIEKLILASGILGDWVSILVEEPWGGSLEHLKKARRLMKKTILAKGYHRTDDDVKRSFDAGATYVLVVGRECQIPMTIFEPTGMKEALQSNCEKMMWNRRFLETDARRKDSDWEMLRKYRKGWLGCASMGYPFPENADAHLFSIKL